MSGKQARRRRVTRSEAEWRTIVKRFERSGLTRSEFCVREGVAASSLSQATRRVLTSSFPSATVRLSTSVSARAHAAANRTATAKTTHRDFDMILSPIMCRLLQYTFGVSGMA